jgi:hypothetical protein
MSDQTPIVNLGTQYLYGMNLSWLTNSTISVAAGGVRNSTNVIDMQNSTSATISILASGYNGLDTGTVAASTFYAVYAIGDSTQNNPNGYLLSKSFSAPTLPFGYDSFFRIGAVLTDGSSHILNFWQYGAGGDRTMYYDVNIAAPTTTAATTYASISLATSLPPVDSVQAIMLVEYTANSATNKAHFLPYGSSASNGIVQFGYGVAALQQGMLTIQTKLNSAAPTFQFKTTSASDTLVMLTAGYIDPLL